MASLKLFVTPVKFVLQSDELLMASVKFFVKELLKDIVLDSMSCIACDKYPYVVSLLDFILFNISLEDVDACRACNNAELVCC